MVIGIVVLICYALAAYAIQFNKGKLFMLPAVIASLINTIACIIFTVLSIITLNIIA